MSTGSRGSLRGKVLTGAAIGILAIGIWIGSWFKGFGLGAGSGEGSAAVEPAASTGEPKVSADVGQVSVVAPRPAEASGAAPPTVSVMIFDDGFRLPKDLQSDVRQLPGPTSQHFVDAALEQVLAAAQRTTGNENGIRVLVWRHRTATVGAENRLLQALREAGFRDGDLHKLTGFYD